MDPSLANQFRGIIESGLIKKEYPYKWKIRNFQPMLDNELLINAQKINVCCGEYHFRPLKWVIFLSVTDEQWIGIYYGLKNDNKSEIQGVLSRFEVKVRGKDKASDVKCKTEVLDMAQQHSWGWNKFIKRAAVGKAIEIKGKPFTLFKGSLILEINLEVYTVNSPHFQNLHLEPGEKKQQRGQEDQNLSKDDNNNTTQVCKMKTAEDWMKEFQDIQQTADRKLYESMQCIFRMSKFCDFKLIAKDGKHFHVHKAILASRSTTLYAIINMEEEKGFATLKDINFRTLHFMLEYIYTGRIPLSLSSVTEIVDLASAAKTYELPTLLQYCFARLAEKCRFAKVIG